jgi:hypothetical protein
MRTAALGLLLSVLSVTVLGCSSAQADDDTESSSSELGATLTPAELAATKAALRALSSAGQVSASGCNARRR